MAKVARMEHHRTVRTQAYPIDVILREIATGQTTVIDSDVARLAGGRTLRHATEYARRLLSDGNRMAYDEVKKSLPAFTPAGYSSDGSRDIDTLTGRVCLEWDDVDDPAWAFSVLAQSPFTLAAWYSLSGGGLKALFKVEPVPTPETFTEAWYAVPVEFEEIGEPDLASSRHSQPQGLVWSPELYHNPDAQVITYDPESCDFHLAYPHAKTDADFETLSKLPPEYQALLVDLEFDENGKCPTRVPCPSTHHEHDSFENLRANATVMSRREDGALHFHCFKCGKTKIFAKGGTRTRRAVKLQKNIVSVVTENLEDSQAFIKAVLTKDLSGQIFGLHVDTGTGKTEQAIVLKDARPIFLTGSHALGKEIYLRARDVGKPAFLYRGLLHNPDGAFPHEKPCIQPEKLDDLRRRGANPYRHVCGGGTDENGEAIPVRCPAYAACEADGFRSQWKFMRDEPDRILVLAIRQLFIDPVYKTFITRVLPLTEDDIVIVDDASNEGLFLEASITLQRLQRLSRRWKGKATGDFALALIEAVSAHEGDDLIRAVKDVFNRFYDKKDHREQIYRQLRKVFLNEKELSLDDAIAAGHYRIGTEQERKKIPVVEKRGWTLLDKLRIFFKHYPNPETAPMRYYDGTLTFALPPQLYKTPAALGFMGATLDKQVFQKTFSKGTRYIKGTPEFYDSLSTAWHPEAKVFQLRTNRNPRATLLDENGCLSRTGEFYYACFTKSRDANAAKHALISYKSVIAEKESELEGVATSWYHNTEGLDTVFQDCEIFHIIGMPGRKPTDVDWVSRVWQVTPEEVGHKLVVSELLQAVGRARLVRKPSKVVLWTSQFIEGVTDRAILFDETDWQVAGGDLEKLQGIVSEREKAESSGDTQAYAEATGQSERTARRHTTEQRRQHKSERDADIHRRYTELEQTQQEIADALGIGLATVNRVLNR